MFLLSRMSCATLSASLLATSILCTGCSGGLTPTASSDAAITVTGNWQISSAAPAASRLPALSGELTGTSAAMTGILHADSATACVSPSTAIAVTGSADANKLVTLTGTGLAGGALTITGTLAADGKSLSNATYNVTGGTCAFTGGAVAANGQSYASITGSYTGTFRDSDGDTLPVSATLTQTPASDTTGNFQLSGTGTFSNPCLSNSVTITNSQVTGGNFDITYSDSSTGNSIEALGTFSTDGKNLTVTSWTLTGSCGAAHGSGSLTRP